MIKRKRIFELRKADWRVYVAIATGIGFTVLFFYFGQAVREIFRYYSNTSTYDSMIVLSPGEAYVHDLFLAFIASTAGFAAFIRTLLSFNLHLGEGLYSRITLDQTGFPGYYLHIAFRLGVFYGGFAWSLDLSEDIDLMHEMWPFFVLSIIVVFLHQWLTLRVRIKQASMAVMGIAFVFQFTLAALLACVPVVDYDKLNRAVLELYPSYILGYELPESRVFDKLTRRSLTQRLSVGYSKELKDTVVFLGMIAPDTLSLHDVNGLMSEVRESVPENEQSKMVIELCADKAMPAAVIVQVIEDLGVDGPFHLQFMVKHRIPMMGIPAKFKSEEGDHQELFLKNNKVMLNDTVISKQYLYDWAKTNTKKISIRVDDQSTYESLVSIFEELYAANPGQPESTTRILFDISYLKK